MLKFLKIILNWYRKRLFLEMIYIEKDEHIINSRTEIKGLSYIYNDVSVNNYLLISRNFLHILQILK